MAQQDNHQHPGDNSSTYAMAKGTDNAESGAQFDPSVNPLVEAAVFAAEHYGVEAIAVAVGAGSAVGGIAALTLGLESDNPGGVPNEDVVTMPEVTVYGSTSVPEAPDSDDDYDYDYD